MALYITSLNSGSNGNCYYIGNEQEAILIDAGLSCRETEKRMKRLGLDMLRLRAVFVSHEHSDHIKGVPVLSRKYDLPVYITEKTLAGSRMDLNQALPFSDSAPVNIGSFSVKAFSKHHDACDPYSFTVSCAGTTVGVFTDIGQVCGALIHHFQGCHAAFLEANYEEDLLAGGRYPVYLKKRISGGKGHLSNKQALDLFRKHKTESLSHLILSHLSADNNRPELVKALFEQYAGNTTIAVASRYQESLVYEIGGNAFGENAASSERWVQPTLF